MKALLFLLIVSQIELEPVESPPGELSPSNTAEEIYAEPSSESMVNQSNQKDIRTLDQEILLRRLKKLYGEFGRKSASTWKVDAQGETLTWVWENGSWKCDPVEPKPQANTQAGMEMRESTKPTLDCNRFKPVSLLWWESAGAWLDGWSRLEKRGFLLDETEKQSAKSLDSGVFGNLLNQESFNEIFGDVVEEEPEFSEEDSDEPFRLGGKRLALEEWRWVKSSGEEVKVYTSLRNNWVERIDQSGQVEYILAKRPNKWSPPRVEKIILERDGKRLTFEKKNSK